MISVVHVSPSGPGLPTILTHLSESKKGMENEENQQGDEPKATNLSVSEASETAETSPSPCAEPELLGTKRLCGKRFRKTTNILTFPDTWDIHIKHSYIVSYPDPMTLWNPRPAPSPEAKPVLNGSPEGAPRTDKDCLMISEKSSLGALTEYVNDLYWFMNVSIYNNGWYSII